LFANARLAQRVGISNVPKDEVKDEPDLTMYYTPVKEGDTSGSLVPSDGSWVIQDETSIEGKFIRRWRPFSQDWRTKRQK
jgi:hypothetical protein